MFLNTGQFTDSDQPRISIRRLLRKVFFDDWPMKLIALVITIALYMGVSGELGSGTFTLPLNLRISDNAEFINVPTQEVEVVLKGDKNKIDDLSRRKNDLIVFRDLTDIPIGDRVIDLTPDTVSIDLPAGVTVSEIRPSKIAIKLEAVIEKDIPVKAETSGVVPNGMEIYGETVVPQKVRVRGPASFMNSLEFVSTEKIDVATRAGDFTAKQVAVTVSNPKARLLDAVVDVAFRIGETRVAKTLRVPAKDGPPGKKIAVEFYGPGSLVEALKPGELKAEMVKTDTGAETPRVDLPPDVRDLIEVRLPGTGR